jgi:hypothetical protein
MMMMMIEEEEKLFVAFLRFVVDVDSRGLW